MDVHFIHARSPEPGAVPLADHPRLARLGGGVPEGDRPADRSGRPRRLGSGRLRCGVPVTARLRLQRQAQPYRLGRRPDRRLLGGVDGRAGLRPLRSPGRRLGLGGQHRHRHPAPRALPRHPPEHGDADAHGAPRPAFGGSRLDRRGAGGRGRAQVLRRLGHRLQPAALDATPDARLRPHRLAGRSGGVDPGEVPRVDRLRRAPGERPQPGRVARQRDALLAERQRHVIGAPLLGDVQADRRRIRREAGAGHGARPAWPSSPRRSCRPCAPGASRSSATSDAGR